MYYSSLCLYPYSSSLRTYTSSYYLDRWEYWDEALLSLRPESVYFWIIYIYVILVLISLGNLWSLEEEDTTLVFDDKNGGDLLACC